MFTESIKLFRQHSLHGLERAIELIGRVQVSPAEIRDLGLANKVRDQHTHSPKNVQVLPHDQGKYLLSSISENVVYNY